MRPTILLTRPQKASRRFAGQLRDRLGDVRILRSALLQIRPLVTHVDVSGYAAVIATSANAVPFGAPGQRCYCVGDATARAAQAQGMKPISAGSDAKGLVRRILADQETGPLLHIRGAHARGAVAETLTKAGVPTQEIIAYDQVACPLSNEAKQLLSGDLPVIVPVFSPRTAALLSAYDSVGPNVVCVALSPAVADKVENMPADRIKISPHPDVLAMLNTIEGLFDAQSRLEGYPRSL